MVYPAKVEPLANGMPGSYRRRGPEARAGDLDGTIDTARSVLDNDFETGEMLWVSSAATVLVDHCEHFMARFRAQAAAAGFEPSPPARLSIVTAPSSSRATNPTMAAVTRRSN